MRGGAPDECLEIAVCSDYRNDCQIFKSYIFCGAELNRGYLGFRNK